ncbi:MAG: hypothetical protein ACREH4_08370 [Vitreimonas sp.]
MAPLIREHWPNAAAFLWGVAEATLFFIVPDVIVSYVAVTRGARASVIAALCAAIGAAIGGALMFLWSVRDPGGAYAAVLAVPAISEHMANAAHVAMVNQGWFAATVTGPLSSTPYKLYAILAPHAGAALPLFFLASIAARLPRFLIVGAAVALIAHWLKPKLPQRHVLALLAVAWVLFYAAFFTLVPS